MTNESIIHTGQAVGWYRCDGKNCPICGGSSVQPVLKSEPWLYAIAEPSGAWHDGEQCVFGDAESAQDEVDLLNDDLPEGEEQYKVVPLFRDSMTKPAQ